MNGLEEEQARLGEGFCPIQGHPALVPEKQDPNYALNPGYGRWGWCAQCGCSWKISTVPIRAIECVIERKVPGFNQIVRSIGAVWIPRTGGSFVEGQLQIKKVYWDVVWEFEKKRHELLRVPWSRVLRDE